MRVHYPTTKAPWTMWMLIAVSWTHLASASCTTAQWKPLAGQTVGLALKALDITLQDLKALNPSIDVDLAKDYDFYDVPYKERLVFGSWSTGCPRLLQIPLHPIVPIHTPTVRKYETGASYTHGCKFPTNTGPYAMPGTGVIIRPTSTTGKGREASIIATSCTIMNSMSQSLGVSDDVADTVEKPTSETYGNIPIGTLMTLIRVPSARTTFDEAVEQTAVTADNEIKTSMAAHSQKSTAESISINKLGVESMMGKLYTQLEHSQTLLHTTTAVDLISHVIAETAQVSTTVLTTPHITTTLTAESEDTNSPVLITSTITLVQKQTVTRASPGQTTLPKPICGGKDDLRGHVDIQDQRVRQTAFEWCSLPAVKGLMSAGDGCVKDVQRDSWDVLYEYSICWAEDCVGESQDRQKPLGDEGPRCEVILHQYSWKACNNGGVGGQVQAGCLIYKIRAGVGKGQGY
ncbi:uncharacterized protein BKA55DRAFT_696176 [Fusarium redolens]|jgi:hypothetical protein|uniref:LysM domain-containing protein n=1 Tax=Fusarium redolens TaxID=48865 RepID=A0A9P9G3D8_FUSRE|nr:uncharacterized protein BKA55DRAFT_696176 [Fusarium redolens]KAH7231272.1 hypothetical protein BKA55DRAFT_696176 [Fusarium redolens]